MRRRTLLLTGLVFGFSQTVIGQNRPSPKLPKVGMLWHAGNAEEEGSYFEFADAGVRGPRLRGQTDDPSRARLRR